MSLSLVLMAYIAGLATALLGLAIHSLWHLREPRQPPLPKMTVERLKAQRLDIRPAIRRGAR